MTVPGEEMGGDPPCWAHHFDPADGYEPEPLVADLGACPIAGASGAIWSLPHGGDLDANLVRLGAGKFIVDHVNDDVDVLIFVLSGRGQLTVEGRTHLLASDVLALVPRGTRRAVAAGSPGITYLSIHSHRSPLTIAPRRERAGHHDRIDP